MRGSWRQLVLLVAGLLGALAVCLVGGAAGFRLTVDLVGPYVANNFLLVPLVMLLAVLVGIGCAVLGGALAGALFLALGVRSHLRD